MDRTVALVILFSGRGSNLARLIDAFEGARIGGCRIRTVPVTNNPDAGGIALAAKRGVESVVLDHRRFESREAFDRALVEVIERYPRRLVAMAGFMRIVTEVFTARIEAINIHPSLLPLFRGYDALRRSFESGMKVGGVTVHRVTAEVDGGEILAQRCVAIEEGESLEDFAAKIHAAEHDLYPRVVARLLLQQCGLAE